MERLREIALFISAIGLLLIANRTGHAKPISLYCFRPNAIWQYTIDVDYGSGSAWEHSAPGTQVVRSRAHISDRDIFWSYAEIRA